MSRWSESIVAALLVALTAAWYLYGAWWTLFWLVDNVPLVAAGFDAIDWTTERVTENLDAISRQVPVVGGLVWFVGLAVYAAAIGMLVIPLGIAWALLPFFVIISLSGASRPRLPFKWRVRLTRPGKAGTGMQNDKPGWDFFGRRIPFGIALLWAAIAFLAYHNWNKDVRLSAVCEQVSYALDAFWEQVPEIKLPADVAQIQDSPLTQAQSNLLRTLDRVVKQCPGPESLDGWAL